MTDMGEPCCALHLWNKCPHYMDDEMESKPETVPDAKCAECWKALWEAQARSKRDCCATCGEPIPEQHCRMNDFTLGGLQWHGTCSAPLRAPAAALGVAPEPQ